MDFFALLNSEWGSVGDNDLADYMSSQGFDYEASEAGSQGFQVGIADDWPNTSTDEEMMDIEMTQMLQSKENTSIQHILDDHCYAGM